MCVSSRIKTGRQNNSPQVSKNCLTRKDSIGSRKNRSTLNRMKTNTERPGVQKRQIYNI